MSKKNLPDPPQFEPAMEELEKIVRRLEQGGNSLDDDLTDYTRAMSLVKVCHDRLAKAERSIELLSGVKADGTPVTQSREDAVQSLEEKQGDRSRRRSARQDDSLF